MPARTRWPPTQIHAMLSRLHRPIPGFKGECIVRFKLQDRSRSAPSSSARPPRKPETRLLTVRRDEGVYRARFNDRALRGIDTHKLRAEVAALHTPGNPPTIILSLRNLDSLASGSLGALAQLTADLEQVGGVLVLYAIPREIARVIKKTRLDRIINTARDRSAARKKAAVLGERRTGDSNRHYAA